MDGAVSFAVEYGTEGYNDRSFGYHTRNLRTCSRFLEAAAATAD